MRVLGLRQIAAIAVIVTLSACGDSMSPGGSDHHLAALTPPIAAVGPFTHANFKASDDAGGTAAVTFRVNGIPGGSPAVGTISASGVYSVPDSIPEGDTVVVTAVSVNDTTQRKSSTVFFMPSLQDPERDYYVHFPRVVDLASPSTVRLFIFPAANVSTITFIHDGALTPLTNVGNAVFMLEISPTLALSSFVAGSLHGLIGQLDYRAADGSRVKLTGIGVNVRDANMPNVTLTQLAPDAQRSPFVLNLRYNGPYFRSALPNVILARVRQLLGDRFDFVALVSNVNSNNNRNFTHVRNDVQGIGLAQFDNELGGRGRLRGIVNFPLDEYFDPGSAISHEVGHDWINFATDPTLHIGSPHWPMSSIASESVMGFSIGGAGGEGGMFPFSLETLGNGNVRVHSRTPSTIYSSWDLYLMGLLPSDSVPPALVLPPTLPLSSIVPGFETPATTYTIAQYVAAHGTRVPAYGSSPTEFTIATVVLSYGRLLSAAEMSYFDAAASRIESTTAFQVTTGFATAAASSPFSVATGGRARLHSRLD